MTWRIIFGNIYIYCKTKTTLFFSFLNFVIFCSMALFYYILQILQLDVCGIFDHFEGGLVHRQNQTASEGSKDDSREMMVTSESEAHMSWEEVSMLKLPNYKPSI